MGPSTVEQTIQRGSGKPSRGANFDAVESMSKDNVTLEANAPGGTTTMKSFIGRFCTKDV
ncbi:transcriptional regulator [Pseudomonas chlororaphis subsp. aurantiaca]|jgi:hypothetical protein|nr:transcriptional regulator [Pseudomonas chlororaphis subsp. aurantiaca]